MFAHRLYHPVAVVPVSTPNDTAEPQLLSMSPEQVGLVVRWASHGFGVEAGMKACQTSHPRLFTLLFSLTSLNPQAEETAAKLRELEADMLLRRQENRRGWSCCGCFVLTWAGDTLPDHLRVWEMTID